MQHLDPPAGSDAACEDADEVLRGLDEKLAGRIRAYRESERLSEEDFAIRITLLVPPDLDKHATP